MNILKHFLIPCKTTEDCQNWVLSAFEVIFEAKNQFNHSKDIFFSKIQILLISFSIS